MRRRQAVPAGAAALFGALTAVARAAYPVPAASVDAAFTEWTHGTPGCAVGISEAGTIVLEKAYALGLAIVAKVRKILP